MNAQLLQRQPSLQMPGLLLPGWRVWRLAVLADVLAWPGYTFGHLGQSCAAWQGRAMSVQVAS